LGLTALSMPASGVLPVKALLAEVDLAAFRPVLAVDPPRRAGGGELARADRDMGQGAGVADLGVKKRHRRLHHA